MTVDWASLRNPILGYGDRSIDLALAHESGRWFAVWKSTQSKTPHIAAARSVDGPWSHIGDGRLALARSRDLKTWFPAGVEAAAT